MEDEMDREQYRAEQSYHRSLRRAEKSGVMGAWTSAARWPRRYPEIDRPHVERPTELQRALAACVAIRQRTAYVSVADRAAAYAMALERVEARHPRLPGRVQALHWLGSWAHTLDSRDAQVARLQALGVPA